MLLPHMVVKGKVGSIPVQFYCLSLHIKSIEIACGISDVWAEVLVEKQFCSFFNPLISFYIYYDQYKKYGEKKIKFPRFVSMEMAAIFDFRALTKVHITLKRLLQMQ